TLPFLWIGVAMTLRRAVDAGRSPWLALAFFVPLVNYVVMLALCRIPTVPLNPREERAGGRAVDARPALVLYGIAAGLAVALPTAGGVGHLASLVVAIPVLAGLDGAHDPTPLYEVDDSVVVAAPPAEVWRNVVSFSELAPPTEALFRLGIAYPIRARIDGVGAGAIRRCEFSTGTFVEPIRAWDAPAGLSFDMTAQAVPLREPSPYGTIAPPH